MAKPRRSSSAVSKGIKSKFDLGAFKKKKNLSSTPVKFKEQGWIPLSEAFQEVTTLPGVPTGHVVLARGHSDTGKTTMLLETAVSAQKMGILPVFLITEMKWSWEHAKLMGLKFDEIADEETGEVVDYGGFFIYADRTQLNTIEDVASFIMDLIREQESGNLPYDLLFMWDSIGSIPCKMSVEKASNNNEWNAGAMSTQFGYMVNQEIVKSRKLGYPYTNTLFAINKVWANKPDSPMGQPKMENKGGKTMWYDSTLVISFGNIKEGGASIIKATADGRTVDYAKITKIKIDKNHITNFSTRDRIVLTPHGFILNDKSSIDAYKKDHRDYWKDVLGSDKIVLEVEGDEE